MTDTVYASMEAGGTKFVCAVGGGPDDIRERFRVDTTEPDATLGACLDFFSRHAGFASLGIAAFGPLELRTGHPRYGHITETPKPGWSGVDLVGPFTQRFGVPVMLETDVNGAALAESRWGAARDVSNALYLTVGTGIGGGAVINNIPVRGLVHPEMGHVSVPRTAGDEFAGICPFHGDCLEGLASGPAIESRWGRPANELDELIDEAIEIEAATLANGIRQFIYVLAPERVIIGGGVSQMPGLHESIQTKLGVALGGYGQHTEHGSGFVIPPGLGDMSGIAGGIALAQMAWES